MCISAILAMIIGRHGGKIAYQTDGISERECGESLIVIDSSIAVNNQKKGYKIGEGGFQSRIPLFFSMLTYPWQIKGEETGQMDCLSGFKRYLFNLVNEILIFPEYHRFHGCNQFPFI